MKTSRLMPVWGAVLLAASVGCARAQAPDAKAKDDAAAPKAAVAVQAPPVTVGQPLVSPDAGSA